MAKLYLLKAKSHTGYVRNQNVLIRATSESEARRLTAQDDHDERWKNNSYASCEILRQDGEVGIIIIDNNGA